MSGSWLRFGSNPGTFVGPAGVKKTPRDEGAEDSPCQIKPPRQKGPAVIDHLILLALLLAPPPPSSTPGR